MIAKERPRHMRLVGLIAARHHRRERAGSNRCLVCERDRSERQSRRALEIARHQEPAGRQGRERIDVVARPLEIGGEQFGDPPRRVLAGLGLRVEPDERRTPFLRKRRAGGGLARRQRLARPFGVALVEQGQVEQPFAGIVDEVELEARASPAPAGGALELDGEPQLSDPAGRLRPAAIGAREARQMFLVGETRHGVVRLRFEARPHDAAFGGGGQDRQARARDQVVDERRQEYGLARARQAGDAEAQRPAGEIVADRAGDESRLEHEIAVTWQGKFRVRKPGSLFRRRQPVWTVGVSPSRPRTRRASDRARAIPSCARPPSSGERKNRARLRRRSDISAARRRVSESGARPRQRASPARLVPGCGRRGRRARVVREGAGEGEQAGQTGVIEPRLFTELDLAFPLGGKNLRRLLGAGGAGMDRAGRASCGGRPAPRRPAGRRRGRDRSACARSRRARRTVQPWRGE